MSPRRLPSAPPISAPLESTAQLLRLIRAGDGAARERLLARYLPILRTWARGRLPRSARDLAETDDLVQITLVQALKRLEEFEPRREGAFLAYLRTILLNSIRQEIRRTARHPMREALDEAWPDPSPVLRDSGQATVAAYEVALATLSEEQQEAVILRLEFQFSYPEIAEAIDSPSADAARMMVKRAVVRLAEAMHDETR